MKGVFAEYAELGVTLSGADIAIGGDIPGRGGLSSSASLEVGTAILIEDLTGFRASDDDFRNRQAISWLAQRAENNFVGVNCGIMDQGAIALGRKGHAMLMNCSDLSVDHLPADLAEYCLLIANTCKERKLEEVPYNERRHEVDEAFHVLRPLFDIESVRDMSGDQLGKALTYLKDPLIRRRARHVFSEQQRVSDAVSSLKSGDIEGFGRLLNDSHRSLRIDFEVTGPELDVMIGIAQVQPGVAGARMMGAGFGGCGLVLTHESATDAVIRSVTTGYEEQIGYAPEFHIVEIGSGASRISPGTRH